MTIVVCCAGCCCLSLLKLTLTRILSPDANTSFDGCAGTFSARCLRFSLRVDGEDSRLRFSVFFFLSRLRLLLSLFFKITVRFSVVRVPIGGVQDGSSSSFVARFGLRFHETSRFVASHDFDSERRLRTIFRFGDAMNGEVCRVGAFFFSRVFVDFLSPLRFFALPLPRLRLRLRD